MALRIENVKTAQNNAKAIREKARRDLAARKAAEIKAKPRISPLKLRGDARVGVRRKSFLTHSMEGVLVKKELVEKMVSEGTMRRVDDPERVMRFIASTERVDRMGDILRQEWDLKSFQANPVILWDHDQGKPLGRSVREEIITEGPEFEKHGRCLVSYVEFQPKAMNEFADQVFQMYRSGFLKGGSVGYVPLEIDEEFEEEQRKSLGLGPVGVVFLKSELAEFTLCTVPANQDALATEMKRDMTEEQRKLYEELVGKAGEVKVDKPAIGSKPAEVKADRPVKKEKAYGDTPTTVIIRKAMDDVYGAGQALRGIPEGADGDDEGRIGEAADKCFALSDEIEGLADELSGMKSADSTITTKSDETASTCDPLVCAQLIEQLEQVVADNPEALSIIHDLEMAMGLSETGENEMARPDMTPKKAKVETKGADGMAYAALLEVFGAEMDGLLDSEVSALEEDLQEIMAQNGMDENEAAEYIAEMIGSVTSASLRSYVEGLMAGKSAGSSIEAKAKPEITTKGAELYDALVTVFGDAMEDLDQDEISALEADLESMMSDEGMDDEYDAAKELADRLGGANNLLSYVASLMAGEEASAKVATKQAPIKTKSDLPSDSDVEEAGAKAGKDAASWYEADDWNRVLQGIEDGDPEVLDTFPFLDLSGQHAGGTTDADILNEIGIDSEDTEIEPEVLDELINLFRDAYDQAVSEEIERRANQMADKSARVSRRSSAYDLILRDLKTANAALRSVAESETNGRARSASNRPAALRSAQRRR